MHDLPDPKKIAIFLDLDGTLVDIAPEPHLVVIPPDLPPLNTSWRGTGHHLGPNHPGD